MKNTPKMKGKGVFIPFSHMCKQWGMKDFTSLPEYVAHFTFPLYAFLEHRIIIESCVFIRKLYFYPWAVNTGKLIQYFWPPGGAHDTACSVSLLPSSLSEFLQRGSFKSEQCRGSHPLDAVSAAIWRRNAQNKTTPGKGKTNQTRGQVGQCNMGRCWEVREGDYPSYCECLFLYRESWLQALLPKSAFFPLVKK